MSSSPVHMLAGKRTEELVMRNGVSELTSAASQGSTDITPPVGMDECRMPEGSLEDRALTQRLEALQGANLVRMDRAATGEKLRTGQLDWDEFLDEPPQNCVKVPVLKMLQWAPNIGRIKARKIIGILPSQPGENVLLCELTVRDRYVLSAQLGPLSARARARAEGSACPRGRRVPTVHVESSHGEPAHYEAGCRCKECTAVWKDYCRESAA